MTLQPARRATSSRPVKNRAGVARYGHVLRAIYEHPWAILPSYLSLIVDLAQFRAEGGVLSEAEIQERLAAAAARNGPRSGARQTSNVAVIPLYGVISQRVGLMSASSGGTALDSLTADFRSALADPAIDAIVFDVDSPGGTVDGVPEFAAELRAARGTKPIAAVANTMAASAAYWIASQVDELSVSPSGQVGSIGVRTAHTDETAAEEAAGFKTTILASAPYKTEGDPLVPLTDDAAAHLQAMVDELGAMFVRDVAKGRSTSVDTVRSDFGQGRMLLASDALAAGMVDRIETLDEAVRRIGRQALADQSRPGARADAAPVIPDDTPATAPGSGLPLAQRLALVSESAEALAAHVREHVAMRAKEGRGLSGDRRDELVALAGSLRASADELAALAAPPRRPRPLGLEVLEAAVRYQLTD